jgi:hypothetical protein
MINCFAEMVAAGVKPLAISPPLRPDEYQALKDASEDIVKGSGILSCLETSLLVTDLQSPEFTEGKWSILYFENDATLQAYLNLKDRQAALEASGTYTPEARKDISRDFMKLLGYPDATIERKLDAAGGEDPFVLLDD